MLFLADEKLHWGDELDQSQEQGEAALPGSLYPEKTVFLNRAEAKNARIKNGLEMLILQAEKSWQIQNWTEECRD